MKLWVPVPDIALIRITKTWQKGPMEPIKSPKGATPLNCSFKPHSWCIKLSLLNGGGGGVYAYVMEEPNFEHSHYSAIALLQIIYI